MQCIKNIRCKQKSLLLKYFFILYYNYLFKSMLNRILLTPGNVHYGTVSQKFFLAPYLSKIWKTSIYEFSTSFWNRKFVNLKTFERYEIRLTKIWKSSIYEFLTSFWKFESWIFKSFWKIEKSVFRKVERRRYMSFRHLFENSKVEFSKAFER